MVQLGTPLPATLAGPALSEREAVADACYRAFTSIDYSSEELLESCIAPDVTAEIASIPANNYDELKNKIWMHVSSHLDTTHHINNLRINFDTETTARCNFNVIAVHCVLGKGSQPDVGKFTTGALYNCDMVKMGDLWKFKTMMSTHLWATGEPSIMAPPKA